MSYRAGLMFGERLDNAMNDDHADQYQCKESPGIPSSQNRYPYPGAKENDKKHQRVGVLLFFRDVRGNLQFYSRCLLKRDLKLSTADFAAACCPAYSRGKSYFWPQ